MKKISILSLLILTIISWTLLISCSHRFANDISSVIPSEASSEIPSDTPNEIPSKAPSEIPSDTPSELSSDTPSEIPSDTPSEIPSDTPSEIPSDTPSEIPSEAPSGSPDGIDSADYKIIKQSGKTYIVFDDISKYQNADCDVADIDFKNLAEFKDTVTNGKLTRWQKEIAVTFEKDTVGEAVGIATCDFDNLWEAQTPKECKINYVYWQGECYSFLISSSSELFGFFYYYTEDVFFRNFDMEYTSLLEREDIEIKSKTETVDGEARTTYYIKRGPWMQVRYEKSVGNKTMIVDESHTRRGGDSYDLSSITLYFIEDDMYYSVYLTNFTERPTEAWLFEFGMKPYLDANDS